MRWSSNHVKPIVLNWLSIESTITAWPKMQDESGSIENILGLLPSYSESHSLLFPQVRLPGKSVGTVKLLIISPSLLILKIWSVPSEHHKYFPSNVIPCG